MLLFYRLITNDILDFLDVMVKKRDKAVWNRDEVVGNWDIIIRKWGFTVRIPYSGAMIKLSRTGKKCLKLALASSELCKLDTLEYTNTSVFSGIFCDFLSLC